MTNGVMDVLRTLIEPLDLPGLPEDTRTGLEYMMRRLALQSPVTITLPVSQLTIIFFISYFCTSLKQTEYLSITSLIRFLDLKKISLNRRSYYKDKYRALWLKDLVYMIDDGIF